MEVLVDFFHDADILFIKDCIQKRKELYIFSLRNYTIEIISMATTT